MIHKIKALHDNGKGLSIRAISQELGLSRNTVRKYLRMDEHAISEQIEGPSRTKRLDDHRDSGHFGLFQKIGHQHPADPFAFPLHKHEGLVPKALQGVKEQGVKHLLISRAAFAQGAEGGSPMPRHFFQIEDGDAVLGQTL